MQIRIILLFKAHLLDCVPIQRRVQNYKENGLDISSWYVVILPPVQAKGRITRRKKKVNRKF